jgi:uncharacterized membrane protein YqjE
VASSSHGFIDSLRQLGDNLLGTVHDRLELLAVELQEEKFRILRILILANAAIFSAFLALIFLSITITYLFWDSARVWVLAGFTVLYAAICIGIVLALKKGAARLSVPFEDTRREIAADRDAVNGR